MTELENILKIYQDINSALLDINSRMATKSDLHDLKNDVVKALNGLNKDVDDLREDQTALNLVQAKQTSFVSILRGITNPILWFAFALTCAIIAKHFGVTLPSF